MSGLDLSNSAVELANNILPGRVNLGTLDKTVTSNTYDIISAFNVIEHMDNPHIFIRESKRVLTSGGFLFLETPSQESLYHHVMFLVARIFSNANYEIGINPGGHIYKFGKKAWSNILAQNDYKVVMMKSISTPLKELFAKKRKTGSLITLIGLTIFGILARLTGTGNRVFVIAKLEK